MVVQIWPVSEKRFTNVVNHFVNFSVVQHAVSNKTVTLSVLATVGSAIPTLHIDPLPLWDVHHSILLVDPP